MEHLGQRKLADHVQDRARRDQKPRLGGISLVTRASIKVGMKPPLPGIFIKDEVLEPLNLSVSRAADVLGVRRATLSDLVNGKAALSPEMALRVEKAFGISMDTLLRMQAWFDSHAMRQKAGSIVVQRYTPDAT